jgi:pyruvate/2-oxoglutarate dehydrogenase complex dihydrolipoamide acyltransferase (E2) component
MFDVRIPEDCWDDDSEGAISTWLFDDGDKVGKGDVICEVMNEKVASEIEAPEGGILKIQVQAETPVRRGDVIASIQA